MGKSLFVLQDSKGRKGTEGTEGGRARVHVCMCACVHVCIYGQISMQGTLYSCTRHQARDPVQAQSQSVQLKRGGPSGCWLPLFALKGRPSRGRRRGLGFMLCRNAVRPRQRAYSALAPVRQGSISSSEHRGIATDPNPGDEVTGTKQQRYVSHSRGNRFMMSAASIVGL